MLLITCENNTVFDSLPGDVPSLHTLVRQLRNELTIEKLGRQKAEAKVKDLLRRMFGPKSEKWNALQGLLFGTASVAEQTAAAAREALQRARAAAKRVVARRGKRRAPQSLPVLETVRIDPPEEQRAGLVWMRDETTYEEDYKPSQFFRRAIVRGVYAHPKKLHGPRIAPMPVRVIPQSRVGPAFLAYMLVSKYVDHIPYYRQERIDRRGGLDLSAKLRVRYTEPCALLLLTIYTQLRALLLATGLSDTPEVTPRGPYSLRSNHHIRLGSATRAAPNPATMGGKLLTRATGRFFVSAAGKPIKARLCSRNRRATVLTRSSTTGEPASNRGVGSGGFTDAAVLRVYP